MESSKAMLCGKKYEKIFSGIKYIAMPRSRSQKHFAIWLLFFNEHIQRRKKRFLCINCLTVVLRSES